MQGIAHDDQDRFVRINFKFEEGKEKLIKRPDSYQDQSESDQLNGGRAVMLKIVLRMQ